MKKAGKHELRRCPFCGEQEKLVVVSRDRTKTCKDIVFYVRCINCGSKGSLEPFEDFAVDAWNTRAFESEEEE